MNRFLKSAFSLAAVLAAFAVISPEAGAQQFRDRRQSDIVLVTPNGEILDYVPRGFAYARDRSGNRVLIDAYGNIVATEMRARGYYPPRPGPREVYSDEGGNDPYYADDNPYGDTRYSERGAVTGGIPRDAAIERLPLGEEPYPDDNSIGNPSSGDDYASIDPDQQIPPADAPKAAPDEPVITLKNKSKPEIVALQVFLDRAGISPGVIDGHMGSNVTKGIYAYNQMTGSNLDPNDTDAILEELRMNGGLPVVSYTITPADAAGPFVAQIPEDYSQKALLPSLAYTSTTEMLAERFHMDEAFLKEMNPGADFSVPGTVIKVVNPGEPKSGEVARIIADKGRKQVFAYDGAGNLLAAYPASIGSTDTPSPSGTVTVERVALNPGYTYNPKINFQQGANDKILNIPPGPNGPVGTVWMALSKPTYGIHGTPDPSKIGRTQSHGCIRLTNWDATELAKMVKPGVTVEFVD
ncbi:L,D-transpeptidase [Rhizobium lentis]|uniref:L,D-transpeptidase n=1 Tax=Rhizobium lentis TaxID=1138194 RepID=A0A9Q3M4W6_9HYPH|nr:L,D-transpeptidase [Rhizobium lentis]MBX5011966.1 L,D-transpeptidase [Rhizobium lentis]MBX5022213.1 L,D-transpeptidase [Rhizobium lentis]MBX5039887.1 L,D-transpeptidase [Rhizobium lentis]MBX5052836.1 L,D-transpeptidase [Rhizobium lentis]MBX5064351.1 L,D-transpeptidase [Rhizobium lentis]